MLAEDKIRLVQVDAEPSYRGVVEGQLHRPQSGQGPLPVLGEGRSRVERELCLIY